MSQKKKISIIGGGAAALSFASFVDTSMYDVTIYEKNKALGRKFLVAGKGGFNLTHSEEMEELKVRYTPKGFMDNCLDGFSNQNFRDWLAEIGLPTYVGSSKRVFPTKGIKPIEVLDIMRNYIESRGVLIEYENVWNGWEGDELRFNEDRLVGSDLVVFCLGGASWKVTGSDGSWNNLFEDKGVEVIPFLPANCAYEVEWDKSFLEQTLGKPLKNIAISCNHEKVLGEVVITSFGLEGNAVYSLTEEITQELIEDGKAEITIDLKPMLSNSKVFETVMNSGMKTTDMLSKKLKLEKTKVQMLKGMLSKEEYMDRQVLTDRIKNFPITLIGKEEIDKAISTKGGIALKELNGNFEMSKLSGTYCIGEMLDWNAPTGGYLLQGCFSMGHLLATHLNQS